MHSGARFYFIGKTPMGIDACLVFDERDHILSFEFLVDHNKKRHSFRYANKPNLIEKVFCDPAGLSYVMIGTDFQKKVWNALKLIPRGSLVSYSWVAQAINCPKAVRAVASAVKKNPIIYAIPCHRVIHLSGCRKGFRQGDWLKERLIAYDQSFAHSDDSSGESY